MYRYSLLIALYFCVSFPLNAAVISCSGTLLSGNIAIPPVTVMLGNNIPDYTVLYSVRKSYSITAKFGCDPMNVPMLANFYMTLNNVSSASKLANEPIFNGKTHKIYPTNISGLGISIINAEVSSDEADKVSLPAWPDTAFIYQQQAFKDWGWGNWYDVYLWKIPGDFPATGSLDFTGPTAENLVSPINAADTIVATSGLQQKTTRYLIWATTQFSGSLNLVRGTCDMAGGSKTVQLGKYTGGGNSPWVDASFKLTCPNAAGYGGYVENVHNTADVSTGTITPNTLQNGPIRIQIKPYTPVVSALPGTMELDGTGARGYGVQLAWGNPASLGTGNASNPVPLNTWIYASTLNPSAYRSTAYPVGVAAISGDGTIKMAARFVRTTGVIVPGQAKASVEVLASYE